MPEPSKIVSNVLGMLLATLLLRGFGVAIRFQAAQPIWWLAVVMVVVLVALMISVNK